MVWEKARIKLTAGARSIQSHMQPKDAITLHKQAARWCTCTASCTGRAWCPSSMTPPSPPHVNRKVGSRDAGGVLVIVHCYLHRPSLVPFGHRIPVAPHYLLKLKSSDAIRMVCPCPANPLHLHTALLDRNEYCSSKRRSGAAPSCLDTCLDLH